MEIELLEKQISKIFSYSGIILMPTQKLSLENYLETKAKAKHLSDEDYCALLTAGSEEFNSLINFVTVNETYFFREQKQFDFLEKKIFPGFQGKKMNIWSAACSSGEEPVSLLAMALNCGVDATVYATDIDDNALLNFKKGIYRQNSFRPDGKEYHSYIERYGHFEDKDFVLDKDFIDRIIINKFNLLSDNAERIMNNIDLIFIRNVFIYFDRPTRKAIVERLCTVLKDEGHLLFSMNEIGCMNNEVVPSYLHKKNYGIVYYFQKNPAEKQEISTVVKSAPINKTTAGVPVSKKSTEKVINPVIKPVTPAVKKVPEKSIEVTTETIKDVFTKVCNEINQSNYDKARLYAEEIGSVFKTRFYSLFLLGYTEYYAGDKKKASTLFSTVETIKSDFWPVFFYQGLTLKDLGKKSEANKYFIKCQLVLDSYKDGRTNPYDFIVDSFNPAYIYSLCRTLQRD